MTKQKILVLGAGRSATSLIHYLLEQAEKLPWFITVSDKNIDLAKEKIGNNLRAEAQFVDFQSNPEKVKEFDVLISLLPPTMHLQVAQLCMQYGKSLFTASYNSPQMQNLHAEAKRKNCLIMMECGLDPGLDHITALEMIEEIKSKNGKIISFKSYCGGLVAPESDTNSWGYKISWNPRNVVLAGQGGASKFLNNGTIRYLPYHKLFDKTTEIKVSKNEIFEGYANRDSLIYKDLYQLTESKTFIRGTLRKKHFCKAWNFLVYHGLTDDTYYIENLKKITLKQFCECFFNQEAIDATKDIEIIRRVNELDLFSDQYLPFEKATPAMVLQFVIENKWKMTDEDKDLVVMYHEIEYEIDKKINTKKMALVIKGNQKHTAMSQTVGLPLGIMTKLFLTNKIDFTGVHIPIYNYINKEILAELKKYKIEMKAVGHS